MILKQKITLTRKELLDLVCLRYGIDKKEITFSKLSSDGLEILTQTKCEPIECLS